MGWASLPTVLQHTCGGGCVWGGVRGGGWCGVGCIAGSLMERCWPTHRTTSTCTVVPPLVFPMYPSELPRVLFEYAYHDDTPEHREIENLVMLGDHIPLRSKSKLLREGTPATSPFGGDTVTWQQLSGMFRVGSFPASLMNQGYGYRDGNRRPELKNHGHGYDDSRLRLQYNNRSSGSNRWQGSENDASHVGRTPSDGSGEIVLCENGRHSGSDHGKRGGYNRSGSAASLHSGKSSLSGSTPFDSQHPLQADEHGTQDPMSPAESSAQHEYPAVKRPSPWKKMPPPPWPVTGGW